MQEAKYILLGTQQKCMGGLEGMSLEGERLKDRMITGAEEVSLEER